MNLETKNLTLVPQTQQDALAMVEAMNPQERAQVSPDWLAQVQNDPNPWMLGFSMVLRETGQVVGKCMFKAPPNAHGAVEIAYGVDPAHQNKGYATEAAAALAAYALASGKVRTVRAHTLPEPNASTRVLTKCGFTHLGEVIDPEDGRVWRWEKQR